MLLTLNAIFTIFFVGGAFFFWRQTSKLKSQSAVESTPEAADYSLLSISVPKNNDRTPQAAEQLFASLHGIFRSGVATQSQISLEIASKGQTIFFYVYMPSELKDFVLSQIYAQYPNFDVKVIPLDADYTDLAPGAKIAATELALKKPSAYPIKTFVNFEVDPLSSITGVLSSAVADEEIWFQVIIQPADDSWQEHGEKEIKILKEPPAKHTTVAELIKKEAVTFAYDFGRIIFTGTPGEAEKKEEKKEGKELSGSIQQAVKGIEEKITKLGFETTIRLVVAGKDEQFAKAKLEQLIGAFKQFNSLSLNSFVSKEISSDPLAVELYRQRAIGKPEMIFNITELASLYHFPSETVATPTIAWAGSKKGEPPSNLPTLGTVPADELTVFAQTNYREHEQKFGIKKKDRRLHSYIIGKTGTGKSTLMENMIFDDIREGRGVAVVDPHGELIDHVLDFIPADRINDVVYFSPADYDHPIGFNVLEYVNPDMRNVVASGVVGIFKKIFGESWGPRLEYILRNAILALLEYPNSTLLGIMRILTDNAYRRQVISHVNDPVVKDFFINEFEKYEPKFRQEAIAPIQNKVGQFTSSSTIRNIIGQPKSAMDIREMMDQGKILLADLSTGKIGEDNSALLGSMLITKIQLSAMGRTNMSEEDRRDFYLYVDEFQNFATDSFATILSEARKYRLNLVMINQYISQMPEAVANAVFGNVGTMIAFRVGAGDAEAMKQEFEPVFEVNDLVNLPNRQIYLKMAIDGVTVPAFSASTLPPPAEKANLRAAVVQRSREQFGKPRSDVEEYIADWAAPIDLSQESEKGSSRRESPSLKQDFEKIITVPSPPPVPDIQPEPPVSAPSLTPIPAPTPATLGEGESVKIAPSEDRGEALKNSKIEIINDRFNRRWYSVGERKESRGEPREERDKSSLVETFETSPQVAPPLSVDDLEKKTDSTPESGGVGEQKGENDHLITWEKADELGLHVNENVDSPKPAAGDFLPIDEL